MLHSTTDNRSVFKEFQSKDATGEHGTATWRVEGEWLVGEPEARGSMSILFSCGLALRLGRLVGTGGRIYRWPNKPTQQPMRRGHNEETVNQHQNPQPEVTVRQQES